jgi:acyl carrier protein
MPYAPYDFLTKMKGYRTMQMEIKSAADIETVLLKLIKQGSVEDPDCVVQPQTVPSRDIKGFDSLTVLEVLTELEEETGIHVEEGIFYVDVKPKKYLSIQDVALAVWNELRKGGNIHA